MIFNINCVIRKSWSLVTINRLQKINHDVREEISMNVMSTLVFCCLKDDDDNDDDDVYVLKLTINIC